MSSLLKGGLNGNINGTGDLNTAGGGLINATFSNVTTEVSKAINASVIGYISDKLAALTNFVPKAKIKEIVLQCPKNTGDTAPSLDIQKQEVVRKGKGVVVTLNKEKPTEQMARSFCYDQYMEIYNNNFTSDKADRREKYFVVKLQNTTANDLNIGTVAETTVQDNTQIVILTKDQFIELRKTLGKQFSGGMELVCDGAVVGKVVLGYKSKTAEATKDAKSTKWVSIKFIDKMTGKTVSYMIDVNTNIPHFALTNYTDASANVGDRLDEGAREYFEKVTGKVTGHRKKFKKADFQEESEYKKAVENEKIPFSLNKMACEKLGITEGVYNQIQASKISSSKKGGNNATQAIENDKAIMSFFSGN